MNINYAHTALLNTLITLMPLFFRSDTRSPEEIFEIGFTPRVDYGDEWWRVAIHANAPQRYLERKKCDDAVRDGCVSLSTKFESAALFPQSYENDNATYIYIIALPPATKPIHSSNNNELLLIKEQSSPVDIKEKIIDLHSLQATQTGILTNNLKKTFFNVGAYPGWALHAYEAISYQISPKNITCAIKVVRPIKFYHTDRVHNPSEYDFMLIDNRGFKIEGDIIVNPNFQPKQSYIGYCSQGSPQKINIDYDSEFIETIQMLNKLKDKDLLETPSVYYGLGGKTF